MARLIDGKEIAESIYENINLRARELRGRGVIPKLAVVLVGDNPASRLYVNSKEKRARENGIETEEHHLDGSPGYGAYKKAEYRRHCTRNIGTTPAARAYGQAACAVMYFSR